ncbi:response regulator [Nocardioides rubriscoriae]|uniref:response regulator n=1 Tax=Nocardioides rubriscoriae TaxID=642762 RepID=UPI001FE7D2F8|nr:response regulator transcription factor [Nocardioides rubriscoriae]
MIPVAGAPVRGPGHAPIDILLVDDHRVFADVLAMRMRDEPTIGRIDVACSLSEARANLHRSCPDLVLLDVQLDGEVGLDLFGDLRAMATPPDVLMLSGVEAAHVIVEAFRSGAQGWVAKTAPFDTLMFAAQEVLRGHMYLAPPTLKPVLVYLLVHSTARDVAPSFIDDLTPRQVDVLRCLVEGMSRAECAQRLHLSVHTVRTHVQQLLKQADLHSTLALASRARALGLPGIDTERPAR